MMAQVRQRPLDPSIAVIRKNSIIQLGEWPSTSQRCVTAWYDKVMHDSA
jgi:hypothetical protein